MKKCGVLPLHFVRLCLSCCALTVLLLCFQPPSSFTVNGVAVQKPLRALQRPGPSPESLDRPTNRVEMHVSSQQPVAGFVASSAVHSAAAGSAAMSQSCSSTGLRIDEGEGTTCAYAPTGKRPKVLFVIGPTGVGKSRLGFDLCLALEKRGIPAEILSADSMQVRSSSLKK